MKNILSIRLSNGEILNIPDKMISVCIGDKTISLHAIHILNALENEFSKWCTSASAWRSMERPENEQTGFPKLLYPLYPEQTIPFENKFEHHPDREAVLDENKSLPYNKKAEIEVLSSYSFEKTEGEGCYRFSSGELRIDIYIDDCGGHKKIAAYSNKPKEGQLLFTGFKFYNSEELRFFLDRQSHFLCLKKPKL